MDRPSVERDEVPKFSEAIREDLAHMARLKGVPFPSLGGALDIFSLPGTWAVILYRLSSAAHFKGYRPISRLLFFLNCVIFGVEIHPTTAIGPGLVIPHPVGVAIGTGTRIGKRAMILKNISVGGSGDPKRPGHPIIGDDVVLMDSCKIFGPVKIGDRCILGANAVVVHDIEADMFVFASRDLVVKPLAEMGRENHAAERAADPFSRRDIVIDGTAETEHPAKSLG